MLGEVGLGWKREQPLYKVAGENIGFWSEASRGTRSAHGCYRLLFVDGVHAMNDFCRSGVPAFQTPELWGKALVNSGLSHSYVRLYSESLAESPRLFYIIRVRIV
jgi:hypothetical protein